MERERRESVVWEELRVTQSSQPFRTAALLSSHRLLREKHRSIGFWIKLKSAFLPKGYPDSVTPDYLSFQCWDTLQGLSTYIRSMLSTQALLSGIGVGAAKASVIGATFQWFLRDFTGMLGGIIFTLYQGSNLDSKAKQWRLTADFMNDIGMLLDLISPLFPQAFVTILCIGSLARSVTGVASGATRAALTQHFALRQNAADVSAKEGSQETAATLVGMLIGILVARLTSGHSGALWASFLLLTAFHMFANYKAVRSLRLTSLNMERTSIVLNEFWSSGKVITPHEASFQERIFPRIGEEESFKIMFGARISSLDLSAAGYTSFSSFVQRYPGNYLIAPQGKVLCVIVHKDANSKDFLQAYIHVLVLKKLLSSAAMNAEDQSHAWINENYLTFLSKLKASGWSIERVLIHPEDWRAKWKNEWGDTEHKNA